MDGFTGQNSSVSLTKKRGFVGACWKWLFPVDVFFYWGCWHRMCFENAWDWAYFVIYEIVGVVLVFSFKPYC